jgi:prepilin-type N-terminal cleavage/methylation domain-containing protein
VTGRLRDDGGYSLIELLVVMAILSVVVGGIVTVFAAGINADASQNRRFQAQQDVRVAMDRLRRETHSACTISAPASYNTALSSVTFYMAADNCAVGANTVTWCASANNGSYALYRILAASCAGATQKFASNLTTATPFIYLPPNSHATTLGGGAAGISTIDGRSTLPRLHVDLTANVSSKSQEAYRLVDDIAFRNGVRACSGGAATC